MVSKREKIRAGAFVVVSTVLFASILVSLKYYSSLEESREYFFLYDGSIFGLDKGSRVAFNGVPIGKVKEIGFNKENRSLVKVNLDINVPEDVLPILNDTRVSLKYISLITGVLYVELKGGQGKVVHNPNQPLQVEKTLLDNLEKRLDRLDTHLISILEQVKDLLNDNNRQMVKEFLTDMRAASGDLKAMTTGPKRVLARTEETLDQLYDAIEENREAFKKSLQDTSVAVESVRGILQTAQKEKAVEKAVATIEKIGQASDTINETGQQLANTGKSFGNSAEKSLAKLDELVVQLNSELKATLTEARTTLKSGSEKFESISADVQEISKAVKGLAEKSTGTVTKAEELLTNANAIVKESSSDIRETLVHFRKVSERMEKLGESLNSIVVQKTPSLMNIIENLRQTSAELKEFARRIRLQPSSLIGRSPKDERKFKK